jgi:hypothetical protein
VRQPLLAFGRVGVGVMARDVEVVRQNLGGLAHVELDHRIGQAALEPDHRLEEAWAHGQECSETRRQIARAKQRGVPFDRALAEHERSVAERLGAACQDQIGDPFLDVAIGGVDRLHAGAAVDLYGERGHRVAHAEPQRGNARRVHLVGDDVDAAEDHQIERGRRERLAQQQRPAALHGEVDGGERARLAARLEEWRAAAVDDVDRTA